MPAHRIGRRPLTNAQRQQRWRDRRNPNSALARKERHQQRQQAEAAAEAGLPPAQRSEGDGWRIDTCDFRDWQPPQPAKLILTDPPWGKEYIADLYWDLPILADQWLADKGFLAVMTGQGSLPEVFAALSKGPLQYAWTFALVASADCAMRVHFHINSEHLEAGHSFTQR